MPLPTLLDLEVRIATRTRLASLYPDAKRQWGTLSPGGAMCHLAKAYELAAGIGIAAERSGLLQRSAFRYAALHLPVQWARGYPTLPELVEGAPGVQPCEFAEDHARLLNAFDRFLGCDIEAGRAHPIFGPLTAWEWMRWGYLHADHHLRQFGL